MNNEAFLLEAMVVGTSKAIENQEARGQREQVASSRLPKKLDRAKFEAMGVVFGEDVDDLFVAATLPAGWKFEATDHSKWSKLLDDKGRERAAIFYKAAFYDRSAHANLTRRYGTQLDRADKVNHRGWVAWATDGGERIPDSPTFTGENPDDQARAWIAERYPDWENPLAYWDAA